MLPSKKHLPGAVDALVLATLVNAFYARVRLDSMLAPVFDRVIDDGEWAAHLEQMVAFWGSIMLSTGQYHGKPMQAHLKHRALMRTGMFDRWLMLWAETA